MQKVVKGAKEVVLGVWKQKHSPNGFTPPPQLNVRPLVPTATSIMSLKRLVILKKSHARFVWNTAFSFACDMSGVPISGTPRFPSMSYLFHSYLYLLLEARLISTQTPYFLLVFDSLCC